MPPSVVETAVYTQDDGVVDWRYCRTDHPEANFAVTGTHIGLAFNPSVYAIIANRLAQARSERNKRRVRGGCVFDGAPVQPSETQQLMFKKWAASNIAWLTTARVSRACARACMASARSIPALRSVFSKK